MPVEKKTAEGVAYIINKKHKEKIKSLEFNAERILKLKI